LTAHASDARSAGDLVEARAWLAGHDLGDAPIVPLAGDLSPRRYARVGSPPRTFVLAHYPPSIHDAFVRFARTTELLSRHGVRVPRILVQDPATGWMLLEDLGEATLYDAEGRPWEDLETSYRSALSATARIQAIEAGVCSALNPPLDAALLERELEQTWRVFFDVWAATGDPALDRELRAALHEICRELQSGGLVPCHRDFMPRNLIPCDGGVAVLDHQDLRLGPRFYDLASLLNDSLFPPAEFERACLHYAQLTVEDVVADVAYRMAVVQRSLKAVGTYAAFAAQGATRHVRLIAPTLDRALRAFAATGPGRGLAHRWSGALERGARDLSATLTST
jgi:aminoglycoside/choline kinase family phosphotransferase